MTCHSVFFLHPRSPVDKGYEPFFHISIVEGDISLVLDSEALSRYKLNRSIISLSYYMRFHWSILQAKFPLASTSFLSCAPD